MTAPRSPDHLDDEALSALLEGTGPADAHVADCARCSSRFEALGRARDRLRSAAVAPLAATTVDDLVQGALAARSAGAGGSAMVVPLASAGRRRGRRLQAPPPAWMFGAVAALAVVVGLAGLLRAGGGGRDDGAETAMLEGDAGVAADAAAAGGSAAESEVSADPEVVVRDLGDVADADTLAAALDAPAADLATPGAPVARGSDEEQKERGDAGGGTSPAPVGAAGPPPTMASATPAAGGAGPPDRARCRADAERIGAGRLGVLLTTATLRWAGQPAEVLIFTSTEPTGGLTRQALVLARPGCGLLADLRW